MKKRFNTNLVVVCLVAFSQGVLGLADVATSYLYKDDFGMSPASVALAVSLTNIPHILKPVWGLTSDCFPISGRRRAPYLATFGLLGVASWVFMAVGVSTPWMAVTTMTVVQLCNAFCNVIGEAVVIEQGQASQQESLCVSLFFGIRAVGTIVTAFSGGFLLEFVNKRTIFLMTACFPLLMCAAALILTELPHQAVHSVPQQLREIWDFVTLPRIQYPVLFLLLFMSAPSCADAMFYFVTNELDFPPEFIGEMRMAWGIATLIGIYLFNAYFSNCDYKQMIGSSCVVASLVGVSQILLVTRQNERFGVPDSVFAVLGVFFRQVIGELNIMPILVLCCKQCPSRIEASVYALMMSVLNLGNLIAAQLGGLLMVVLDITQSEFSNLWVMILLANLALVLPLPALLCIPTQDSTKQS